MALVIRLRKMGKNNYQTFRLVVLDKRNPRDGKYLEMLGWYNPCVEKNNLSIKGDRVQFWLEKGAMISDSAKALVKKAAPEVIKAVYQKKIKTKVNETKTQKSVAQPKAKESKPKKETKAKKKQ